MADLVVLMVGENDAFEQVHPGRYGQFVADLAHELRSHGVPVLLVVPPVPEIWEETIEGALMRAYWEVLELACATEFAAGCIDARRAVPAG